MSSSPSSPVTHILGSWVVNDIGILYRDQGTVSYCVGNWAVRVGWDIDYEGPKQSHWKVGAEGKDASTQI